MKQFKMGRDEVSLNKTVSQEKGSVKGKEKDQKLSVKTMKKLEEEAEKLLQKNVQCK